MDDNEDEYDDYEDYEDDLYDCEDEVNRTAFFMCVITVACRRKLLTHPSQVHVLPVCGGGAL
jgi:hypothetical protein